MYYAYEEAVKTIKSHRVLALNRAENEKVVSVELEVEQQLLIDYLVSKVVLNTKVDAYTYVYESIVDSLNRLIYPSITREIRSELTEKSEHEAILLFGENLYNLLLQAPIKGKTVLGVDPGFRTGCKVCVINPQGDRLAKDKIYPHEKSKGGEADPDAVRKSAYIVESLVRKFNVDIIAIGNGTASRETEKFIAHVIKEKHLNCQYVIVSEAGASVYSAGPIAQEEFPDDSLEERSAASIARRLQDPLSELVKIDPKSIGVGQYQHDVNQKELNEQLDFIVTKGVNKVGVDLNTASKSLLSYISGLTKKVAENIVNYRKENGPFSTRADLLKVSGLKEKTFEQCAGFLRITGGDEPLDSTSIHPESYAQARTVMIQTGIKPEMFGKEDVKKLINQINKEQLSSNYNINLHLLNEILEAFISPQRDPRDEFPQPVLKNDVLDIKDLHPGMELQGTVRNIVDFGAFVDIGLHEDGLVHISKMSKTHIKHPMDVLSVGDIVTVYVFETDLVKGKVALTLINPTDNKTVEEKVIDRKKREVKTEVVKEDTKSDVKPQVKLNPGLKTEELVFGKQLDGIVKKVEKGFAFVDIGLRNYAFLHASKVSNSRINDLNDVFKVDQKIVVYVLDYDAANQKTRVSTLTVDELFTF